MAGGSWAAHRLCVVPAPPDTLPAVRRWQQSAKSSSLSSNLQPSGAKADALREEMEEAANRVEICRVPLKGTRPGATPGHVGVWGHQGTAGGTARLGDTSMCALMQCPWHTSCAALLCRNTQLRSCSHGRSDAASEEQTFVRFVPDPCCSAREVSV